MAFLPLILEFFLRGNSPQPVNLVLKSLGYLLVIVGLFIGLFLGIQLLGLRLNALEISTILSATMILAGGILLIASKRKKKMTNPANDVVDITKNLFKNTDLKRLFQNNAVKITSAALLAGFVLSHFLVKNDHRRR